MLWQLSRAEKSTFQIWGLFQACQYINAPNTVPKMFWVFCLAQFKQERMSFVSSLSPYRTSRLLLFSFCGSLGRFFIWRPFSTKTDRALVAERIWQKLSKSVPCYCSLTSHTCCMHRSPDCRRVGDLVGPESLLPPLIKELQSAPRQPAH